MDGQTYGAARLVPWSHSCQFLSSRHNSDPARLSHHPERGGGVTTARTLASLMLDPGPWGQQDQGEVPWLPRAAVPCCVDSGQKHFLRVAVTSKPSELGLRDGTAEDWESLGCG